MRVTRRIDRGERGAVLIIFAVFTLVAVLFLAFVIDIGNQRQNRRQLTSGTDSTALAIGAEVIANYETLAADYSCTGDAIADRLIENNDDAGVAPPYTCVVEDVVPYRSAVVTVRSNDTVGFAFGGVTGINEGNTGSLTSVLIQPVIGGSARPVALCTGDFFSEDDGELPDDWFETESGSGTWVNPNPSADSVVLDNNFAGANSSTCDSDGNWNQVLFREDNSCPGQTNAAGASQWPDQYTYGSPYPVAVNDCLSRVPGAGGLNSTDLTVLEGEVHFLPVFSSADGGGAGIFVVEGFLEVYVASVTGQGSSTTYELEPRRWQTKGTCCLLNDQNAEISICDVGTIGGSVGADDDDCEARDLTGQPPEPEIPPECEGSIIAPTHQVGMLDSANGQNKDKLLFPVTFEFVVSDLSDCGTMTFVAEAQSTGQTRAPSVTPAGTTFTITFEAEPSGHKYKAGETYDIVVKEDDLEFDRSATMTTNY